MYKYIISALVFLSAFATYADTFSDLVRKLHSSDREGQLVAIADLVAMGKDEQAFKVYSVLFDLTITDTNSDLNVLGAARQGWMRVARTNPEIYDQALEYMTQFSQEHGWNRLGGKHDAMRLKLSWIFYKYSKRVFEDRELLPKQRAEIAHMMNGMRRGNELTLIHELSEIEKMKMSYHLLFYILEAGASGYAVSIATWHSIIRTAESFAENDPQLTRADYSKLLGVYVGLLHSIARKMRNQGSRGKWKKVHLEKVYNIYKLIRLMLNEKFVVSDVPSHKEHIVKEIGGIFQLLRENAQSEQEDEQRKILLRYAERFESLVNLGEADDFAKHEDKMDEWILRFYDVEEKPHDELFQEKLTDIFITQAFLDRSDKALAQHLDRLSRTHPESAIRRLILSIREVRPTRVEGLSKASAICLRIWGENPSDGKH